jgi:uncharacterized membrane protein YfcA
MIKRMFELNLDGRTLAILIWIAALVTAVLAFVLATSNTAEAERWLAGLASVALAFVGYTTLTEAKERQRQPTQWQTLVWVGTLLITVFFLARAVTRVTF